MALIKQTALIATLLAVPGLCALAANDRTPDMDRKVPTVRDLAPDTTGKARFQQAHPGTGFTENYGRIERVYGKAFGGGANAAEAAGSFVRDHVGELWGLAPEQFLPIGPWGGGLHAQPLMTDPITNEAKFMLMGFIPHVGGLPVYDSALRVLVRNEPGFPVVLASAQIPDVAGFAAPDAPIILDENAFSAQARMRFANAEITGIRSVVFAGVNGETQPARIGAEFILEGDDLLGQYMKYRFIADPITGEIIYEDNQILHADVSVTVGANKTDQYSMECGNESISPLPHARVTVGGTVYYADRFGVVDIPNSSGSVTVNAESRTRWFNCDGGQGDTSTTVADGGTGSLILNQANSNDANRAWSNAVYFAEEVRNFTLDYNSNFPTIANQENFTINTGVSGSCNAFYNGSSINFYNAGGGCANTTVDVIVHHEYGHHLVNVAGSGQSEYGEGAGDCVGVLITGDPRLAVGFYTNQCTSGIRNADNTCGFSASGCSSCGSAIHTCGQLLSGMVWEVREQLIAAGKPVEIINDLFINSMPLHNGTSINSNITIDWLTLDDDNGNINDGTPNYIQINAGCTIKGVPGPDLDFIAFDFPQGLPNQVDPNTGATFGVEVSAVSIEPIPGSGRLVYRVDGGAWNTIAMDATSSNSYLATIPGAECESTVEYYVTAQADGGSVFSSPTNAPGVSYSAISASELVVAYENDFELQSINWSVINDPALTAGAWERANPSGTRTRGEADPAFDGSFCFVTENGNGNFDIDGGCTTLVSPTIDATSGGTTISYARWWSNDGDGAGSDPNNEIFYIDISDDDGSSWVSLETVGPVSQSSGDWYEVSFLVSDFVDNTNSVRVRFRACDLGTASISEAGLDAFRVESVECDDTGSLPGDLNGDCAVNGGDLGILVALWGEPGGIGDLDGDGIVGGGDLGVMLAAFGSSCP
jgi:hypothetical protein